MVTEQPRKLFYFSNKKFLFLIMKPRIINIVLQKVGNPTNL